MFLELLRTALNTNINFSYISIYSSHLGTYWKSGLYFSVVLPPLSAPTPDMEFWISEKLAEGNIGEQPLEAIIMCSPYNGHCRRAEDPMVRGTRTGMACDNL